MLVRDREQIGVGIHYYFNHYSTEHTEGFSSDLRGGRYPHMAITNMGQAAEWGMVAVEKSNRRLQEKLPFEKMKRGRRVRNLFRLYNFRVRSTALKNK